VGRQLNDVAVPGNDNRLAQLFVTQECFSNGISKCAELTHIDFGLNFRRRASILSIGPLG